MMTLADLVSFVFPTAGTDTAGKLKGKQIVNMAGRHLYAAHPWRFRLRPPVTVSFSNDSNYIELPKDFGEIVGYAASSTLTKPIRFTSYVDFAQRRAINIGDLGSIWATVVTPGRSSLSDPLGTPRLEIWPKQTSSESLVLFYRADWVDMVEPDEVSPLPDWMELAFVSLLKVITDTFGGQDMAQQIGALMQSDMMLALIYRDGRLQPDHGTIQHGAAEVYRPQARISFNPIANPT